MDQRQTKRRGHRPAMLAASLAVCAFGSVPALAQLPTGPPVTVPLLEEGGEASTPDTTTTTAPDTTTTTAPPTSGNTPPTTSVRTPPAPLSSSTVSDEPAEPSEASAAGTAPEASADTARRTAGKARRSTARPASSAGTETFDVAPAATEEAPAIARLRQVTLPAARQFGFPLGLAALVLAFLAVQGRLDARDPKLAMAPLSVDDDLLPFS